MYDYLRQSETQEEGQFVLITNIEHASDHEMKASLFDRLFRAVTGTQIHLSEDLKTYSLSNI